MADQTINPVLPVSKTRNTLQNKKKAVRNKHLADDKAEGEKPDKKKGMVDTYA